MDVIYAEWGNRNRAASLREVLECISTAGACVNRIVIVDNKRECVEPEGEHAARMTVLPGENFAREFGAWDVGLQALGVQALGAAPAANVLLCVNDTFSAHRRVRIIRRLRIARWIRIIATSPEPEIFGQIDPVKGPPVAWKFGILSKYMSSYLFGMNPAAAKLIFPLTAIDAEVDACLNDGFSAAGIFSNALPPAYTQMIEHWLFTPGQWRNAAPLSAENFAFFRLKAKSIIYEHALTCRAISAGIRVSDFHAGRGWFDGMAGRLARAWITGTALARKSALDALRRGQIRKPRLR